jgi:hypothetical protein
MPVSGSCRAPVLLELLDWCWGSAGCDADNEVDN